MTAPAPRRRPAAPRPAVRDYRQAELAATGQAGPAVRGCVAFTVPGNPIPWERARGNGPRKFTARRTRAFQAKVRVIARAASPRRPMAGPVSLLVIAYRESAHRCDWDNLGKSISDSLNGIVWEDDHQVEDGRVLKRIDRDNPRVEVLVCALTRDDAEAT